MAIYDPKHRRMVTFGGHGGNGFVWFNDVPTLSLSGEPQWNALKPRGAPPEVRGRATAIYDPVRNRMVVFGGVARLPAGADVWALSLSSEPAWQELTPSGAGPAPRFGATAIYDPVRERMLVFGGCDGPRQYDDVWALSLQGEPEWTQILPAGPIPSARFAHTAIYDPVHDRMVICSGIGADATTQFSDSWALSLSGTPVWTELAPYRGRPGATPPGSRPSRRWGHSAIYDPARERMLIFGGADPYSSRFDEVWALSLADSGSWAALSPVGAAPPARFQATAIYDASADRMVVFGGDAGAAGTPYAGDVWALALSGTPEWRPLLPPGKPPSVRSRPASAFDPERARMIVLGGRLANESETDEVWAFSLAGPPDWSRILPPGPSPRARSMHTAIYDPRRDRVVVFGGFSRTSPFYFADVWALSLSDTPSWTEITPTGPGPHARAGHTAIYDPEGDRMLVFGGSSDGWFKHYGDVWALSLSGTPTWTALTPAGTSPVGRAFHTAIYDPRHERMVILGGITGAGPQYLDDLWALSLSGTPSWTRLEPSGAVPGSRQWHTAIYDAARERMVVYGGSSSVWALPLRGRLAWAELIPEGAGPGIRIVHTTIYDALRDRMVVFGGTNQFSSYAFNDVWALDWRRRGADPSPRIEPTSPLTATVHPRPNPFRERATLELAVDSPGRVTLTVHDVTGRAVRSLADAEFPAGPHTFVWDGGDARGRPMPNGIYFVRLSRAGVVVTEKIVLMR